MRPASQVWHARLSEARWMSPIALLLLWELGARTGVIPPRTLAAPSSVLLTMVGMIRSGELPSNLFVSFWRALVGLAIGATIGMALGLAAGLSRQGDAVIDPVVQIKRTIP